MGLSVPQPEQKSPETTQYKRAQKEPPELRDSYQSHQNKAKHYYQTDGMSTPFACAVAAEWQNLDGVRFGVVGNFPPVANLEARRNHRFSLGRSDQCSKTHPSEGAWPTEQGFRAER
jgi:hypothetical protein